MSAYVDGMLENAEKSAFEAHIHTCKDCKRELDLLKNTLILLADAKYSAPENFTYEVREKLKSAVPEKRRTFARFGKFSAWAAAFVILAAVAIGNPVWKEFNDRTVKNAVEKSDKFVQNKDVPLSEIFDAETDKINEYFPLKKGDGDGLHFLARSLGKSDTDGQSALILQAERALNMRLDEAVSDKNKNARLYKSLGFYFGILLVIMFF